MRLTPYAQQQPHTCAVACLRMVAEYYGVSRMENDVVTFIDPTDGLEHTQDRAAFLADWQRASGISVLVTRP